MPEAVLLAARPPGRAAAVEAHDRQLRRSDGRNRGRQRRLHVDGDGGEPVRPQQRGGRTLLFAAPPVGVPELDADRPADGARGALGEELPGPRAGPQPGRELEQDGAQPPRLPQRCDAVRRTAATPRPAPSGSGRPRAVPAGARRAGWGGRSAGRRPSRRTRSRRVCAPPRAGWCARRAGRSTSSPPRRPGSVRRSAVTGPPRPAVRPDTSRCRRAPGPSTSRCPPISRPWRAVTPWATGPSSTPSPRWTM